MEDQDKKHPLPGGAPDHQFLRQMAFLRTRGARLRPRDEEDPTPPSAEDESPSDRAAHIKEFRKREQSGN